MERLERPGTQLYPVPTSPARPASAVAFGSTTQRLTKENLTDTRDKARTTARDVPLLIRVDEPGQPVVHAALRLPKDYLGPTIPASVVAIVREIEATLKSRQTPDTGQRRVRPQSSRLG